MKYSKGQLIEYKWKGIHREEWLLVEVKDVKDRSDDSDWPWDHLYRLEVQEDGDETDATAGMVTNNSIERQMRPIYKSNMNELKRQSSL